MSGVTFSVPANDGSSGRPTSQTSVFLSVPAAPASDTALYDYDLDGGDYFRLTLTSGRHLRLEFQLSGYGSATADLGSIPPATWVWISCGFTSGGGLHLRGDVTPLGGATTTTTALVSSGAHTGQTLTDLAFGSGVALTSFLVSDFPNDVTGGWLMSRLVQDQIAANDAGGNPRPIPTVDFLPGDAYREYLAHDPLGAGTVLSDSGTAGLDMTAGPAGLELASAGPPLVSGASAPAGHEGDIQVYLSGEWVSLPAGAEGSSLKIVAGRPAWV